MIVPKISNRKLIVPEDPQAKPRESLPSCGRHVPLGSADGTDAAALCFAIGVPHLRGHIELLGSTSCGEDAGGDGGAFGGEDPGGASEFGTYADGWRLQMRLAAYRTGSGLCCEKSIMTDLMKALRERREQLRSDLLENAVFQEYDLVCRLLERHEASVAQPSSPRRKAPSRMSPLPQKPINRPAPFTRMEKGMSAVIEASADFLREKGARAASAEYRRSWSVAASWKRVRATVRRSPPTWPRQEGFRQRAGRGLWADRVADPVGLNPLALARDGVVASSP